MAAQLREDPSLEVETVTGHIGETRVEVDGLDVIDALWYPKPSTVVKAVRDAVAARDPSARTD